MLRDVLALVNGVAVSWSSTLLPGVTSSTMLASGLPLEQQHRTKGACWLLKDAPIENPNPPCGLVLGVGGGVTATCTLS
eukprot:6111825-Amphidinium_carterae.1